MRATTSNYICIIEAAGFNQLPFLPSLSLSPASSFCIWPRSLNHHFTFSSYSSCSNAISTFSCLSHYHRNVSCALLSTLSARHRLHPSTSTWLLVAVKRATHQFSYYSTFCCHLNSFQTRSHRFYIHVYIYFVLSLTFRHRIPYILLIIICLLPRLILVISLTKFHFSNF